MYKKMLVLLVLSVFLAGCVSNAEQPIQREPEVEKTPDVYIKEIDKYTQYSDFYTSKNGINYYADSDKAYLLLYFTVENTNCKDLRVGSYIFNVTVDNVEYRSTFYIGDKSFPNVTLQKGGKAEGFVMFEVPNKDTISYNIGYDSIYGCTVDIK